MPRTRPPFPPEFRREAVELMRVTDKSLPQLSKCRRIWVFHSRCCVTGAVRRRSTSRVSVTG